MLNDSIGGIQDARCHGIAGQKSLNIIMNMTIPELETTFAMTSLSLGIFGVISNLYIMYVIGTANKLVSESFSL